MAKTLWKEVGLKEDRRLVVIGLHIKVARVEDIGNTSKDSCLLQKLPDADVVEVEIEQAERNTQLLNMCVVLAPVLEVCLDLIRVNGAKDMVEQRNNILLELRLLKLLVP